MVRAKTVQLPILHVPPAVEGIGVALFVLTVMAFSAALLWSGFALP